jgi:hypothetical protein
VAVPSFVRRYIHSGTILGADAFYYKTLKDTDQLLEEELY